jgi:uncharacterized protein YwqG
MDFKLPAAIEPFRSVLLDTKEEFIRVRASSSEETAPWRSKVGGLPYLPNDHEWPKNEDGAPLFFLAQINFQEIPALKPFPTNGIVQFFIGDDDLYGMDFDDGEHQRNFRVLFHPDPVSDLKLLKSTLPTEKVEFDLNTIDSAFMKSKIFKGMEFVFNQVDTSKVTGKTYLPIFINESIYDVYGDNLLKKEKSIIKANKNSGLSNGDGVNTFIKDLYNEYNIYNNHLTFFDKSFTSPISTTGIDVYNYVLRDSAFIDNKWCYNIVFYPRRKNEFSFTNLYFEIKLL